MSRFIGLHVANCASKHFDYVGHPINYKWVSDVVLYYNQRKELSS